MLMKKSGYIAIFSAFLLSSFSNEKEITEVKKPEQELMFLITYDNYSWGEEHSAYFITTDGKRLNVPEEILGEHGEMPDDWAEQLIQFSENTLVECTIPENDLAVMYNFVNNIKIEDNPDFKYYADTIYDTGYKTFYLLEKEIDGGYIQQKICVSGQDNKYIDDDNIIDFCNFMNENGYFNMIW